MTLDPAEDDASPGNQAVEFLPKLLIENGSAVRLFPAAPLPAEDPLRDAGIRIIVVSNNSKKRVKRAVEKFGIDYVYWALKPFTFGIDRAMKEFHYENDVDVVRNILDKSLLLSPSNIV